MSPAPRNTAPGFGYSVKVEGAEEAAKNLLDMSRRADDPGPIADDVRDVVGDSNRRRFASSGFGDWDELSPETVDFKEKHDYPPQILIRTGHMAAAMAKPEVVAAEGDKVVIGTDVEYAHFANYGTKYEPDRQLVELQPEEQEQLADMVTRHIVDTLAE